MCPRFTAAMRAGFCIVVILRLGMLVASVTAVEMGEGSSISWLDEEGTGDGCCLVRLRIATVQRRLVSERGASCVTISLNPFQDAFGKKDRSKLGDRIVSLVSDI